MHKMLATNNSKKMSNTKKHYNTKKCVLSITIFLLGTLLFSITASAWNPGINEYSKPVKYKGLAGINVGNAKPKTSFKILAQPVTVSKTLSKHGILKQKARSVLGSNNNKNNDYSTKTTHQGLTREALLKGWHLERKCGKLE